MHVPGLLCAPSRSAILRRAMLAVVMFVLAAAQGRADEPAVLELWPEGVPGLRSDASPEKVVNGRIVNVHRPTLLVYAPSQPNGTAVVFCPGGGYHHLTIGEDGGPETQWLNSHGVTVFVLKYRMAEYGHPAPLQDLLRAIRFVRSRASEYRLKPDRIGVLGASAGAHLAATGAIYFDDAEGKTGSALDSVNARPDFAILIYPVITMDTAYTHKGSRESLLGKSPSEERVRKLSLELNVRRDMPPVFLAATMADRSVPVENTLRFYQSLRDAGVAAEMHVYAQGSHGNSLDPRYGPTALWPKRCEEWLRFNGWLAQPANLAQ